MNWITCLLIIIHFLPSHHVMAGLEFGHLQVPDSVMLDAGEQALLLHNYADAVLIFSDCIRKYRQDQDWGSACYAAARLARCYIETKDWKQSLNQLRDADKFWKLHGSSDHPLLPMSLAKAYFYSAIDEGSAMELVPSVDKEAMASSLYSQLIDVPRSNGKNKSVHLTEYYLDYAKYLTGKGKYESAIKTLDLAANTLGEDRKSQLMKFWLVNQRARILADRGDTEGFCQHVELLAKQLRLFDPSYEMAVEHKFLAGECQYYLNNHLLSAHIYRNIYWEEKNRETVEVDRLATSAGMAGTCFIECDSFELAEEFLRNALHFEQQKSEPRPNHIAHMYRQLARLEFRYFKRGSAARKYFGLAMNYYQEADNHVSISKVLMELAAMKEREDINKAIFYMDLALDTLGFESDLGNADSLINLDRNIDDFFDPLIKLAELLLLKYKRHQDERSLLRADQVVKLIEEMGENTQNGKYSENTKRVVSEHFRRGAMVGLGVLQGLSRTLGEKQLASRAFDLMEHNRYRILHHDVTLAENRQSLNIPDSIVNKASGFLAIVRRLEAKFSLNPNENDLLDSLESAQFDWNQIKGEVTEKYPNYYTLHYEQMLSLDTLQANLKAGEQVLEYFWGDSLLFLLSATHDSSSFSSLSIKEVRAQLEDVLTFIHLSNSSYSLDTFLAKSHMLFQQILEPFLFPGTNHLFISPDGLLNNLPFAVLLTSEPSKDGDTIPYLLRKFESQYIYSCNLWHREKDTRGGTPRVLAMAYGLASKLGFSPDLDLPFSVEEVASIGQHLGESNVTILEGRSASRGSFLKEVADHNVVHLALHGVADTNHLERAHLLFPQLDSSERFLFAHDLYDLDADLQLAVLSACQTGVGKQLDGEGVFSIARGFAYAGTPSIIMSLWNANDQTTSQIMGRFYELLAEEQNFSEALRQAKINYLDEASPRYKSPYYWATLVGYGHMQDKFLSDEADRTTKIISALGAILLLILMTYCLLFKSGSLRRIFKG